MIVGMPTKLNSDVEFRFNVSLAETLCQITVAVKALFLCSAEYIMMAVLAEFEVGYTQNEPIYGSRLLPMSL